MKFYDIFDNPKTPVIKVLVIAAFIIYLLIQLLVKF